MQVYIFFLYSFTWRNERYNVDKWNDHSIVGESLFKKKHAFDKKNMYWKPVTFKQKKQKEAAI